MGAPRVVETALLVAIEELDTLYVDAMLVMLTLGLSYASGTYVEAALLISLVGFASSTALPKYLLRGEVIE